MQLQESAMVVQAVADAALATLQSIQVARVSLGKASMADLALAPMVVVELGGKVLMEHHRQEVALVLNLLFQELVFTAQEVAGQVSTQVQRRVA
jgi:hypothetical protein